MSALSMNRGLSRGDALCLAAIIFIWGTNFVVMKVGLQSLSPMLLGALRFAVAALPLLVLRKPQLPARYLVAYGLVQGVGQFGLLFIGLRLGMTAGMASVVMQTQAFFTLLLGARVLHEPTRPRQWAGLVLALAGLVTIASAHGEGPGQMSLIGFLLTLGAALMWGISNLIGRLAATVHDYDPLAFIAWTSLVPVAPNLLLAGLLGGSAQVVQQVQGLNWQAFGAVLYLGLLGTLLAYSLWTRLLKRHPANRVVPWSLLVPVVGMVSATVFFGEQPNALQMIGTGAVLLGLMVNQGLLQRAFRSALTRR